MPKLPTSEKTEAPEPPKPSKKSQNTLESFLKAGEKLSQEDRETLMDLGVVLPVDVDPSLAKSADVARYGYYCKLCGSIALYFVGESFLQPDGTKGKFPPHSMPIQQIPFIQPNLPRERVFRTHPICQHCCNPIEMKFGRMNKRRIIHIEPWRKAKHAAIQKMKERHVPAHSVDWKPGTDSDGKVGRLDSGRFPPADQMSPAQLTLREDVMSSSGVDIAGQPYRTAKEHAAMAEVLNPETLSQKGVLPNTPAPFEEPR